MFVTQAHSFRQQARLAITLAWVGGYTNITTLLACGTVASHMTGISSMMSRDIGLREWTLAGYGLFLVSTFCIGAMISGFCTELGRRLGWESIYVLPIVIETMLLGIFAIALAWPIASLYWIAGLATLAMGLQNATITRISSGVVRTTHVTGVVTDLGLESVQFFYWLKDQRGDLRRQIYSHKPARRLVLLASIYGSFCFGSCLAAIAFQHTHHLEMLPPVLFLGWIIYQDISKPISEIEPSKLVSEGKLNLPAGLAIYHLRRDHDRQGSAHRMPNLLAWSDRLPPQARVVILDLAEVSQLDSNAAMELRAVLAHFQTVGRQLIIAGLNEEKFQQINHTAAGSFLSAESVCPDIDLAIGRGMSLLI